MPVKDATAFRTPAAGDPPSLKEEVRRLVAAYQPERLISSVPLGAAMQTWTATMTCWNLRFSIMRIAKSSSPQAKVRPNRYAVD
jgi:hypothetical protein